MNALTKAFSSLFAGHPDVYGLGGPQGGCVKLLDHSHWPAIWWGHLEGNKPIGTYCLSPGNVTRWGCVDIDSVPNQWEVTTGVVEKLEELGAVPYVELSRRKGFHVWWFYSEPVEGWMVRLLGLEVCRRLGVTLEVNPKQDELTATLPYGNYVRLPYPRGWEKTKRQCCLDSGWILTPEQFIAGVAYSNRLRTRGEAIRSPLCPSERALGFRWPAMMVAAHGDVQAPMVKLNQGAADIVFRGARVVSGSRDNQLFTAANLMWGCGMPRAQALAEMQRIWERQVEQTPDVYPMQMALGKVERVFDQKGEKPPRAGEDRPLAAPKVMW